MVLLLLKNWIFPFVPFAVDTNVSVPPDVFPPLIVAEFPNVRLVVDDIVNPAAVVMFANPESDNVVAPDTVNVAPVFTVPSDVAFNTDVPFNVTVPALIVNNPAAPPPFGLIAIFPVVPPPIFNVLLFKLCIVAFVALNATPFPFPPFAVADNDATGVAPINPVTPKSADVVAVPPNRKS
jgi:hypothetical protein